jgi:hypothetical protein
VDAVAPSSEQRKVAEGSLSAKTNVALVDVLGSAGRLEIAGAGGAVVSTVQLWLSVPVPAVFDAWTRNVCAPWVRLEYKTGDAHAVNAAPSRLHLKAKDDWFDVKENVAEVLATGPDGPAVIVTTGGLSLPELDANAGPAATEAATTAEIKKSVLIEETIIPPQSVSANHPAARRLAHDDRRRLSRRCPVRTAPSSPIVTGPQGHRRVTLP